MKLLNVCIYINLSPFGAQFSFSSMITLTLFFNRYSHLRGRDTFIFYTCLENTLQTGLSDKCFREDFLFFFSIHLHWYSTTRLLQLSKEKVWVTELSAVRAETYVNKKNCVSPSFVTWQTNIASSSKGGFWDQADPVFEFWVFPTQQIATQL